MFWIQLSTFVLFNLLILALLVQHLLVGSIAFAAGQHAGGGAGDYNVWRLIADIEAEKVDAGRTEQRSVADLEFSEVPPGFPEADPDQPAGRHHLRVDRQFLCGEPRVLLVGAT
ncbi:hypothetical protein [Saccharopolyspora sp. NPDC002376]